MKILSPLLAFFPIGCAFLPGEHLGIMAFLPALLIEAACLFALAKIAPNRSNNALEAAMLIGTTVTISAGSLQAGTAISELTIAALILAIVIHAIAYLTLCGFTLKKRT